MVRYTSASPLSLSSSCQPTEHVGFTQPLPHELCIPVAVPGAYAHVQTLLSQDNCRQGLLTLNLTPFGIAS